MYDIGRKPNHRPKYSLAGSNTVFDVLMGRIRTSREKTSRHRTRVTGRGHGGHPRDIHEWSSLSPRCSKIPINFRAGGYADRGTLYNCQPLEHTPRCMRSVHFEVSPRIVSVRSMSMRPGNNELLHIPLTQPGTEQQGTLSVRPAAL